MVPRSTWEKAVEAGLYEGDTLATQGFIHFSTEKQVHLPANALFPGRDDLLLLEIDESRLPTPMVWEPGDPADPGSMQFPHLYAPLPLDAVVAIRDYRPGPDGTFEPPEL